MSDKEGWHNTLGHMVTKRTSVMTPLLVLNAVLVVAGVITLVTAQNITLLVFEGILLIYTLYRYERFAKEQPWMLSSGSIQRLGMQLTMGDSTKGIERTGVIEGQAIENPIDESQSAGRLSEETKK